VPRNWDLVVTARPPAAEASLEEQREEFARSLRKLGETGKVRAK
jgi:RNase P protein component